jgi:hypothetical protein
MSDRTITPEESAQTDESLTLEQIAAKIKPLLRVGIENALEVGALLVLAQSKLPEGMTFKQYCADNFKNAQSTLDLFKRLAVNLEKCLPLRENIRDEILTMGILEADAHLSALVKGIEHAVNKPARTKEDTKKSGGSPTPPDGTSTPPDFSKINANDELDDEPPVDEQDGLRYFLEEAKLVIDSQQDKKARKAILDSSVKYLRGDVTLDQVPDVTRQQAQSGPAKEAPENRATV